MKIVSFFKEVNCMCTIIIFISVLPSCTAAQKRQGVPTDMLLLDKDNKTGNASADCAKRDDRISCPDAAIKFFLYSGWEKISVHYKSFIWDEAVSFRRNVWAQWRNNWYLLFPVDREKLTKSTRATLAGFPEATLTLSCRLWCWCTATEAATPWCRRLF